MTAEKPETAAPELKPCPFCGNPDAYTDRSADCSGGPVVGCFECSAHVLGNTMEEAIAAWNYRADPVAVSDPAPEAQQAFTDHRSLLLQPGREIVGTDVEVSDGE